MTDTIQLILNVINLFFLAYLIGYSTFLFLSVLVGSANLYQGKQLEHFHNKLWQSYYVPISILVPAYNEDVTIVGTIQSLLALDYKLYEIIVIDDGSTDQTASLLIDTFHLHPVDRPIRLQLNCQPVLAVYESTSEKVPITLVCKQGGGKADSLNLGINCARYPYFVCMDADSVLQHDSLERIVRPVLEYKNVVAVGGSVRPSNGAVIQNGRVLRYHLPHKLLACMQALEYDRSFLAARILLDKFNGNMIISGAFGLFEKKTVIAAGGYDPDACGEDMELVVRLHAFCRLNGCPYQIKYAADAICWSQAPETLSDLSKQRRRWQRGLLQCMRDHRRMFANPRYGAIGMISYPYFLLYELFSPCIELLGLASVFLSVVMDMLNLKFMLAFLGFYTVYGALLSLTAFFSRIHTIDLRLSAGDLCRALLLCIFEITFLRFYLAFVRATVLFSRRSHKCGWEKPKRKKWNSIDSEL